MGTPALSKVGIALEPTATPGEQLLLAFTAIAATMSLTTQPPVPSKLHITIYGNTNTGSLVITGKDVTGAALAETIPPTGVIPLTPGTGQSGTGINTWEYVTIGNFASVNASAVVFTTINTGFVKIEAIAAAKYAFEGVLKHKHIIQQITMNEMRGVGDLHTRIIESVKDADIDTFEQMLYPDNALWLPAMALSNNPTRATIPASPTVLKTATTFASSPTTISTITAPTTPGMLIQFVNNSSVTPGGSVALSGNDVYGNAQSETIYFLAGASTFTSALVYSTITGASVVVTGPTAGTMAINGYFLNSLTFQPSGTTYTAALELFTGTESSIFPFFFLTEATIEGGADKETKITGKGKSGDYLPIGDRTTTPLSTSRVTSLTQSQEIAVAGWQTNAYLDAYGGTPLTTAFNDLLDWKITFKTNNMPTFTSTNNQNFNRVYRKKWECDLELTVDFINLNAFEDYRRNNKKYWAIELVGPYVGTSGGPQYKKWQVVVAIKAETFEEDYDPGKEKVEVKIKARAEYEPLLGYGHEIIVLNQQQIGYLA